MNEIFFRDTLIFQNPEYKPLEDLKLLIEENGLSKIIPALDKHWIEKKYFLNYETPDLFDLDGKNIIGAKERWFELTNFILNDLIWLLHLPFYRFWSNIIYNPSIMDSIITFLQEAPTFYTLENFLNTYDLKEHFDKIRQNILTIFARLVTNKESPTEYLGLAKHAHLLYNNYIFTIPILMDLCQQYGRDNKQIVEKIVNSVFILQPFYKEDLRKAAIFITQVLRKIEKRFENCPTNQDGKAIPLSERGEANVEISLSSLEDMILYLLDTVSTVNIFLHVYIPSVNNFKAEDFITKIISVYGNTIPEMYKRLNYLAFKDETIPKYMELKHRLDVTRIEILHIYRTITYKKINDIVETRNLVSTSEIGEIVEDFLFNLMHTLSEKEFVIDYHNIYPVIDDFQILLNLYPDLDTIKCEFIINSIFTFLDEPVSFLASPLNRNIHKSITKFTYTQNDNILEAKSKLNTVRLSNINTKSEIELISDVKDILCDLGEGMIQKCLKHYNYNKEAVINAILEDSLPIELKSLDPNLPYISPDPKKVIAANDAVIENKRLNIYDNDEFDIMTKDVIDISKIHKGKRKDKYKNLNELLNEKSHIAERRDIYHKYSIVTNEYDDEYDDTYDDQDISSSAQDDIVEVDTRSFTILRVLNKQQINNSGEAEEENIKLEIQINKDNCLKNPTLLATKDEEKRLNKQKNKVFDSQTKNIGQGKSKEVMDSRKQKNKHKASRANHNRRTRSQWKHNYGLVPL